MSIYKHTLRSERRLDQQKDISAPRKLKLPQIVTIIIIFFFNTQLLEYVPLKIGPLTQTILMELIAFALILPSIHKDDRILDTRDKSLFFVGFFMFVLAFINLSGSKGETQQKTIFTSLYVYFFVVYFFSGRPEYGSWLRRLHLFPALATIYLISTDIFSVYGMINFDVRIRDNYAACYLAVIVPICWVQFQRERGLFRFLNLIVIGATPLVFVVTASRTAFIVFLVVTILTMITEKTAKRTIILVVLLLILLTLFFLLPEQSVFISRIFTLRNPIAELGVDRVALWKAAILSIKEHPIFGGDFRANVLRLVLEAAPESNYANHIFYGVAGGNFGVHNGYLAVMVDFGIIVAFLYFRFFLLLGKALFHTRQKIQNKVNRSFLIAGLITLIGYAVANIAFHIYIGQNFFILWAMLQCSIKNSLLEEAVTPQLNVDVGKSPKFTAKSVNFARI
ncbi:MAG: O-antigen ligase family protein [Chloroflexi bacterium]|nr:O-antigen ligase family protein [Chloroflexota bacterium]